MFPQARKYTLYAQMVDNLPKCVLKCFFKFSFPYLVRGNTHPSRYARRL
jgi:hypothetical protein